MYELTGKVAIVTGAAQGLGQGIAEAFAKQGAIVCPTDRPGVSLDATIEKCKAAGAADVFGHDLDITSQDSINAAVADVKSKFGRIDILANNAGLNRPKPSEEITEDLWDSVIDVNLKGSFFMTQAVLGRVPAGKRGHDRRVHPAAPAQH